MRKEETETEKKEEKGNGRLTNEGGKFCSEFAVDQVQLLFECVDAFVMSWMLSACVNLINASIQQVR